MTQRRRRGSGLSWIGPAALSLAAIGAAIWGTRLWLLSQSPSVTQTTPEASAKVLEELETLSQRSSAQAFESARAEQAIRLQTSQSAVDGFAAVYFFPELLPAQSLERDFAYLELKPELAQIRQGQNAREAFRLLENRVTTYELGAAGGLEDLSPEARTFLKIYGRYATGLNRSPADGR